MILTIIFAAILLLGIIGQIVHVVVDENTNTCTPEWFDFTCFSLIILGIILNVSSLLFIFINLGSKDIDYEKTVYEKQVLEYRLEQVEQGNSVTGNELVYNDVVEFNNKLRNTKKWANNPWTSWFNNDLIADNIDYIEIPNLNGGGGVN